MMAVKLIVVTKKNSGMMTAATGIKKKIVKIAGEKSGKRDMIMSQIVLLMRMLRLSRLKTSTPSMMTKMIIIELRTC
jgi:hypothetical protein